MPEEIEYPIFREPVRFPHKGEQECKYRTTIDYEGINDAECLLVKDHPGDWHYAIVGGPIWWK